MQKYELTLDSLKEILEHIHSPEALNAHPWVQCHFVQDALERHPAWTERPAGWQLLQALMERFQGLMPAAPPKQGLRLDAHWSRFGFLAAKYFVPLQKGEPSPQRYQDVWEKIDDSILFFVFGEAYADEVEVVQAPYRLLADEFDMTPPSTLSDWHKKGLESLLEAVQVREEFLTNTASAPQKKWHQRPRWRMVVGALLVVLLLVGIKFLHIYRTGKVLYADVSVLRSTVENGMPPMNEMENFAPLLDNLQLDLAAFRAEVDPFLWLAPAFRWVPEYGCEISQAEPFLDMASRLTDVGVLGYQAGEPLLQALQSGGQESTPPMLIDLLLASQDGFEQSASALALAQAARDELDTTCLSPRVDTLISERLDPILELAESGLTLAVELPNILGATDEGPKTYLLLVQNVDELRPSGGFITAAGNVLVQNGEIISVAFEDSGNLDDWTKPYPAAPWQLQEYMNSPVLVFRDSNWFPDFPTSALYAEYLYSYINGHSVDGVIAFNQYLLVRLLDVIGPIKVEGVDYLVNADNVISYMREAKVDAPGDDRKFFIHDLFVVLVDRIAQGNVDYVRFGEMILNSLNEHQLLVQVDNQDVMKILSGYQWDGSFRVTDGDFLYVLDSNIGFNKTNALIDTSLIYDIDLTDIDVPRSNLAIVHRNNADSTVPCVQWHGYQLSKEERVYPMNRCYWDYLRFYTPAGVTLLGANPQTIPGDWMVRRVTIPAKVDRLDSEFDALQGFGILKVVPGGKTLISEFQYALPEHVIEHIEGNTYLYHLHVQKQAGTLGHPFTLRMHFGNHVEFLELPAGTVVQGSDLLIETDLRVDREFKISFKIP